MRSSELAERVVTVRRHLYRVLLILGLIGLANLLLSDLRLSLSAGAVPAAGELLVRMTPLTQGPSMDGFGAWSPDGKEIAFMRDGQILLTDPTGKKVRVLTSEQEAWDAAPVWRPDGKAIAYARLSTDGEQSTVMILDLGTGRSRKVARETDAIGYLAWSPDGRGLYYTTKDQILRVDLATGAAQRIFLAEQGWELLSGGLAITRDGKALIFGGGPRLPEGMQYNLWLLPLDGGAVRRLTTQGGIMPALDPAGRLVAYRNPRQETGIWIINLATLATERVVPDEPKAMYFHPNFAPDGHRLVLSRLLLAPPPARSRGGFTSHLYLHTLEGSGRDR